MNTELLSIVGAGHSGSTLLDLLLGSHSQIISTGEIGRLDDFRINQYPCTCGDEVSSCDFWASVFMLWDKYRKTIECNDIGIDIRSTKVDGVANRIGYRSSILLALLFPIQRTPKLLDAVSPLLHERRTNISVLYNMIREISGRPLLVDSTKSIQRYRQLNVMSPRTTKAIFLTRDGRAIVASKLRRSETEIGKSAREWRRGNLYTMLMMRTLPKSSFIHVRYEELCRAPEETMNRICSFTGIPYEPQMLEFRTAQHHNIGGNRMRMNSVSEIKEDLKWRSFLTAEQLVSFEKIAGGLNRKLLGDFYLP